MGHQGEEKMKKEKGQVGPPGIAAHDKIVGPDLKFDPKINTEHKITYRRYVGTGGD